jgi:hypothetical protein
MLSVSLDCSFLIAPSVFSNVYVNAYRMEVLCGATTAYENRSLQTCEFYFHYQCSSLPEFTESHRRMFVTIILYILILLVI